MYGSHALTLALLVLVVAVCAPEPSDKLQQAAAFHLHLSLLPLSGDGGMCQDYIYDLSLVRDPTEPAVVLSSTTVVT
jgi:hypothetical protein